jgi:hemoglobin
MRTTIYDEIGGAPAVTTVVDLYYERLIADPSVSRYFAGKDMARLKAHQRALVTVALGGMSESYTGRLMAPAHAGLDITDDAFDRILMHLEAVLLEAGVPPRTIAKIVAILEPLRPDVVQAHAAAAAATPVRS